MKNKIKSIVIIGLSILIIILGYFMIKKFSAITGTRCLIRGTIGIPCPSCGITRAIKEVLNGNLKMAINYHPLFWIPPITFLLIILKRKFLKTILVVAVTLVLIVYIFRMIMFFPESEPMKINENAIIKILINNNN